MKVKCHIVDAGEGYEGIITGNGETLYRTGMQSCAEDAEGLMAGAIYRNKWDCTPHEPPPPNVSLRGSRPDIEGV